VATCGAFSGWPSHVADVEMAALRLRAHDVRGFLGCPCRVYQLRCSVMVKRFWVETATAKTTATTTSSAGEQKFTSSQTRKQHVQQSPAHVLGNNLNDIVNNCQGAGAQQ